MLRLEFTDNKTSGHIEIKNNYIRFIDKKTKIIIILQNNNFISDFLDYFNSAYVIMRYNEYYITWDKQISKGFIVLEPDIIFETDNFIKLINYFK